MRLGCRAPSVSCRGCVSSGVRAGPSVHRPSHHPLLVAQSSPCLPEVVGWGQGVDLTSWEVRGSREFEPA